MIRVVVAEDEAAARRRIVRFLGDIPDVQIVGECSGGLEAADRIIGERPDLIFLDVQMPDLDGLGVVERVGPDQMPLVVFVTAFNEYAIKAFELNAVDYLLKPYDAERLRGAVDRARRRLAQPDQSSSTSELRALLHTLLAGAPGERDRPAGAAEMRLPLDRIGVRVDGVLRIVRALDVDWFETEGNYVRVHVGRANHLIRSTAAELERHLDPRHFVRIHRRYLVNIDRVVEVQPWFAGDAVVILRDGTKLRLSRTHRERFHARLLGDSG